MTVFPKNFRKNLRIRGLRQRWLVSAALPVVLLVMAAVAVFTVASAQYYYNSMLSGLEARARVAADTFTGYGVRSSWDTEETNSCWICSACDILSDISLMLSTSSPSSS